MATTNVVLTNSWVSVLSAANNTKGGFVQGAGSASTGEISLGAAAPAAGTIGIPAVGRITIPVGVDVFARGTGTLIVSAV